MINSFQKTLLSLIIALIPIYSFSIEPPNNLVVQILESGSEHDEKTKIMDLITVNYTGWLFDSSIKTIKPCDAKGNIFDSNVDEKFNHKKPFQFILGRGLVIKGWDMGLQNMKINEKRCLVIPAKLAYGNRRIGDIIKPNSTLIFEVKLLEILKTQR